MRTSVEEAAAVLRSGGIVIYPTDPLYSLGALATIDAAVERVFRLKGRPPGKPIPLLLAKAEQVDSVALAPPLAWRLIERFWPGALTLVVPRAPGFHSLALAGGDTVAIRLPGHPLARAIVEAAGGPITGTSANRSGARAPVTAEEARCQLGDAVDFILDAGPCPGGIESTVVDLTGESPVILREGAIPCSQIEEAIRRAVA
ncbi:MAG TPA: L-threonylcarbamoyladenylate synthase [Dehalococcoidia bacterium]|nr:L-threonylcarbamoyladenylate synthase [Dehalococcoidia bacterium]